MIPGFENLLLFLRNVKVVRFNGILGIYLILFYLTYHVNCLENYDFIIVGGGTAGLAVARRLAESGKHSVLVLESGGFPKEGMDVPAFAMRFTRDPDVTFWVRSSPQRNVGLLTNSDGVMTIMTGRVLSGTSNLNLMWFNRGHPKDYDNWGNMTQDSSWNYANMLEHFKRAETYVGGFPLTDQHGKNGPITVSRPQYAPGLKSWLAAGKSLGYSIEDPNGPQQVSFAPVDFAKQHGRRDSAFTGYIQPILGSTPNLRIILNTNVTQIIFEGKRAVGVRFESKSPLLSDQSDNYLYANKEIIVSAGAYRSPQLLQRSGIGPRHVLKAAKIPLVQELPVGENYQNHVAVSVYAIINNRNVVAVEERDLTPENWEYFNKFGDGPYSNTRDTTGQGFVVSSVAASVGESDWPDLHLLMSHSIPSFPEASAIGFQGNDTLAPWEGSVMFSAYTNRPESRGSIHINPKNPEGPPILNVGYLTDPRDVQKTLDGIKTLLAIVESPPYKKLGARLQIPNLPACRRLAFKSDDYWRCYIRYISRVGNHPAGTCHMGKGPEDPEAVVDTRLRVIGVSGLRVVDASIMPTITNANLHAAVYGIAEKAATMILQDNKL